MDDQYNRIDQEDEISPVRNTVIPKGHHSDRGGRRYLSGFDNGIRCLHHALRKKKTALRRLRNQKITLVIDTTFKYHSFVNNAHRKTLQALFAKPPLHSLEWQRIESLFLALGAKTIEGNGSRVRFILDGVVGTFHRPHPAKEAKPYQIRDARTFLEHSGVRP